MNIALHRKIVVSNSDMRKCESLGKELLLLPWKEVRRKTNLPRNDVVWMLPFAISMTLRGNFERNLGVYTFRCTRESDSRIQRGHVASTSNFPRIIKPRTVTIQRTTFKNNNNLQRNTEIIPLSATTSIQQNEKHD